MTKLNYLALLENIAEELALETKEDFFSFGEELEEEIDFTTLSF